MLGVAGVRRRVRIRPRTVRAASMGGVGERLMPPQTKPAGRLWRRNGLGVPKGLRGINGRPEGSYRLPIVVPLLTVERPQEAPEGGEGRRLWCRRYDRCLTFAAAKGWTGFAYTTCKIDNKISADERLAEAAKLSRMFRRTK